MKTVIVKVNTATQTIAEHTVVTQDGQPTVIKAVQKVNYELFDPATGHAPNHIVTKRVGNDLHVSMEDNAQDSDLIIEGFYDDTNSALIGLAENGEYYYYVPDSGEVVDYVTQLQVGDIEGQALGGESQVAPWWVGATEGSFDALPWLVGLAGAGIVGAALSSGGGSSSSNGYVPPVDTTAPDAPTVDTVTNTDTDNDGSADTTTITGKAEPDSVITVTDSNGNVIGETTTDKDGNYEIKVPIIADGDKVEITATDKAGNESDPTEATGDTTAPDAPTVDTVTNTDTDNDGSADTTTITGKAEPDSVITVTDSNGNVIGETTTDKDGNYEIEVPIIADGDKVEITATDKAGNESDPTEATGDTTAPATPQSAPVVTDNVANDGSGDVLDPSEVINDGDKSNDNTPSVTVPADQLEAGDTPQLVVDGEVVPATAVTNPDGSVTLTPTTPLNDGTHELSYNVQDAAGNTSGDAPATTIDVDTQDPAAPSVAVSPEGVVTITPADDDSTEVSVTYTDEDGNEQSITATKDPVTGEWESNELPEGGSIDPTTGAITLPADQVDTSKDVTATAKDDAGNTADTTAAGDTTAPATPQSAPVVTDNVANDGSGDVLDPSEVINDGDKSNDNTPSVTVPADQLEAGDTPQLVVDGEVVPATAVTNPDGSVTLTPTTPLNDGIHELSYNVQDAAGNTSGNAPATTVDIDTQDPAAPSVAVSPEGVVTITPADDDSTEVSVTYTDENGDEQTITATKDPVTGEWESNELPEGGSIDPTTGAITLPADQVDTSKDVTATAKDDAGNTADTTVAGDTTAPATPQSAPVVTDNVANDGSGDELDPSEVINDGDKSNDNTPSVTVPADQLAAGDTPQLVVDGEVVPATAVTNPDGSVTLTPTTPLNDGIHELSYNVQDAAGNTSGNAPAITVDIDTQDPAAPSVAVSPEGVVTITPADDDSTEVSVTYTDEDGNEQSITATKDPVTGEWESNELPEGGSIDPTTGAITLPADQVDTSKDVTATAKDDAGNTADTTAAGDTTAPATPQSAPVVTDNVANDGSGDELDPSEVINDGDKSNDNTPSVTVPADQLAAGDTPQLVVDGEVVPATAVTNPDGSVTLTPTTPLNDGTHELSYNVQDAAGNTSGNAPATTVEVDTQDPAAPSISVSPEGVVTVTPANDDTTEVSVTYTDEDGDKQTITATKDPVTGEWGSDDLPTGGSIDPTTGAITIPANQVDTSKDVTATAKDEAGNTADATQAGDTTAPSTPENAPVVTDNVANDGSGDELDPSEVIADGGKTNDNTPSVTVPADQLEAGDTPQLVVDGEVVPATAVTNPDGSVTLTPTTPLNDGTHELSYNVQDAAGNTSANAPATTIDVDTQDPAAPSVAVSPEGVVTITPADDDSTEVSVTYTDEDGDKQTITATKDPVTGEWGSDDLPTGGSIDPTTGAITIPANQVDTSKDVTATAKDEAGNTADATQAGDTTAPSTPENAPVVTDNVANDGSGDELDPSEVINDGDKSNDNTPSVTVPADQLAAGDTPQLVVDGEVVPATAVTNPDGSVTLTPTTPLNDGTHELSYNVQDAAGNTSGNAPATTVEVDTQDPAAPSISVSPEGVVTVTPANDDTTEVSVTYTDEDGDKQTITATKDPVTGEWGSDDLPTGGSIDPTTGAITIPANQVDTSKDVTATAKDEAGNTADATQAGDTTAPSTPENAPVVTDNVANDGSGDELDPSEVIADGGKTNDNTPSVTVPADQLEAGDTPQLVVDGEVVPATAVTNPDGSVTLTPTTPLNDGTHELSYNVQDAAGNTSANAPATTIDVDTQDPAAPSVAVSPEGVVTITPADDDSTEVSVTYTDEDGDKQTITATKDPVTGEWGSDDLPTGGSIDPTTGAITIPANQVDTSKDVTATAKDEAGNTADATQAGDTTAPSTPENAPVVTDNVANDGSGDELDPSEVIADGGKTNDNTPSVTVPADQLEAGDTPQLVVDGKVVPATAVTNPDGSVTLTPKTALDDGTHELSYNVKDAAGNTSGNAPATTVEVDTQDPAAPSISVSPEGVVTVTPANDDTTEVSVTYTDEDGDKQTITATKDPVTGEWGSDDLPTGGSIDPTTGAITIPANQVDTSKDVTATAKDEAGNTADATASTITATVTPDNDADTVTVSGSTTDVAPGSTVSVTLTDALGNEVTGSATVDADGNYSTEAIDTSTLVDGTITADVASTDNNNQPVTGSGNAEMDAVEGAITATVTPDNDADTVTVSGSTTDVAPGSTVSVTLTDALGNEVTGSATVDADGNYSTEAIDTSTLVDGTITADVASTDNNNQPVTGSGNAEMDAVEGAITATVTPDNDADTVTVSGSTTDVAPGSTVSVTLTDALGNEVTGSATVDADGNYSTEAIDTSTLVDGTITADVASTDNNNQPVTGSGNAEMDAVEGAITATVTPDNDADTVTVSGSTTDVAPGSTVSVTLTDALGNEVTGSATVDADGNYSTEAIDTSTLVDGTITADVASTDNNNQPVTGSGNAEMDAVEGAITATVTPDNDADTVTVSGSTTDVAPGSTVSVTLTDALGNEVTGSATVDADGNYSTEAIDTSTLVDGTITADVASTDNNNQPVTGSGNAEMDAVEGAITATVTPDNDADTVTVSGSTTDVAPGSTVSVTLTDALGNEVTGSATVDADGNYSTEAIDTSTLVDGTITADVASTDNNNQPVTGSGNAEMDAVEGAITATVTPDNDADTVTVSGSTTDVAPGSTVSVTLTDALGNEVTGSATVDADGNYSTEAIDTSTLVDGTITADVASTDNNNQPVTGSGNAEMDAVEGAITATVTPDNDADTVTVSGSTTDVAPGSTVSVTLTDALGNEVTGSATVDADGNYSTEAIDTSTLVDGTITADVASTDNNNQPVTGSGNAEMDAVEGAITATVTPDNDADTVTVSGSTTDVAPGSTVSVTLTDALGNEVTGSATVDADGNYSTEAIDTSTLVDGTITADVASTDNNNQPVTGSGNAEMDAVEGAITATVTPDNDADTVTVSGSTTDVAPGSTVSVTLTDALGNEVTGSATVDADGNYSTEAIDTSTLVDGTITADVASTDNNNQPVTGSGNAEMDAVEGAITATVTPDNDADTVTVSGSTTDVAPGSTVSVTLTDALGNEVTGSATVDADGNYSTEAIDTSTLVDGTITADVASTDNNNQPVTGSGNAEMDAVEGAITATVTPDNDADTVTVSGSTTDVAPGSTVSVTLTDALGNEVTGSATVDADGNYSTEAIDTSTLVDGTITADVASTDNNNQPVTGSGNAEMDAVEGAITATVTPDNDADTVTVSGSTTDVAPGSTVSVTLTDALGNEVTGSATVDADGNYSTEAIDTSTLVDGTITADVASTDNNNQPVTGSGNAEMDAVEGAITATVTPDNDADTVTVSGSTTDVAPGSTVSVTLTDALGNEVTGSATVDADGNYSTEAIDTSTLVDGTITADVASTDNNNQPVTGSGNAEMDATPPTLDITTDNESVLASGETAGVTFTFSEPVEGFDVSDVSVAGGSLSNFTQTDDKTWTATFTKDDTATAPSITVEDNTYTDVAGNSGTGDTQEWTADVVPPTVSIAFNDVVSTDNAVDANIAVGTQHEVTFTFNEQVTGFDLGDVEITSGGGTLSDLSGPTESNGLYIYTATYTAPSSLPANQDAINVELSIGNNSFSDIAGNSNLDGDDADNKVQLNIARPAEVVLITVEDNYISPNQYGSNNTSTEHYGVNGQYTGLVSDSDSTNNPDALEGVTNDITPTISVVLDGPLLEGQQLLVNRIEVNASGESISTPISLETVSATIETNPDTGAVTYTWEEDALDATPTFGSNFRYEAITTGVQSSEAISSKEASFVLDTLAEKPIVNAETIESDIANGFLRGRELEEGTIIYQRDDQVFRQEHTGGEWQIELGRLRGMDTDRGEDGYISLSFVDKAGNLLPESDVSRLYYFDRQEGAAVSTLNQNDRPKDGGPNTGRQVNIDMAGNFVSEGGTIANIVEFAATNDIIVSEGDLSSNGLIQVTAIYAGAGDDFLTVGARVRQNVRIYMEEGNDIVEVDRLEGTANDRVVVDLGEGDDSLIVNGRVDNAYMQLGSGNNTATFNSFVVGDIYGGSGIDTINIVGNFQANLEDNATMDLGAGNDVVDIGGYIQRVGLSYQASVFLGAGDDKLTARGLNNNSLLDAGAGNDIIKLTEQMGNGESTPTLNLGIGVDTLDIGDLISGEVYTGADQDTDTINITSMRGGTVYLGDTDEINITNLSGGTVNSKDVAGSAIEVNIESMSGGTLDLGSGDDIVTMTNTMSGGNIYLANGNDIFNYSGSDISGTVNAGAGNDIFNFTGSNQDLYVSDTTGFERFNLNNSGGELNLSFSDLTNAGTRTVFVDGGVTDRLDFGSNGQQDDNTETRIVDNNRLISANDTFWDLQPTSDQAGYDMYVYTGSANRPNSEGYTVYVDTDITVI
ncbi:Ig-like domain-containing protein [Psychrobacter raelei]|uniref:Ig-like domain-containing protein n=1 Tax=Psychrobacter raelei TaxID=2565531 RepID=UPI003F6018D6